MAIPLPSGDPARAALDLSDEILARLDEATTGEEMTEFDAKLLELEAAVNEAEGRKDEPEVRRLCQLARDHVHAELAAREKELQDAKDYFDEALKEYGPDAQQATDAAERVKEWSRSVTAFRAFAEDRDEYYNADEIVAHWRDTEEPAADVAVPAVERAQSLDEFLQVLEKAESAYLARVEEIRKEKSAVAARIIEERIAKLKEGITAP